MTSWSPTDRDPCRRLAIRVSTHDNVGVAARVLATYHADAVAEVAEGTDH